MGRRPHKIYRIVLNSKDRINAFEHASNSWFHINVGEVPLQNSNIKWQWAIESFLIPLFPPVPLVITSLYVDIPSIIQPNSFSTITKCENTVAIISKTFEYTNRLNYDSIGVPLTDLSWLRGGTINVKVSDALGTPAGLVGFQCVLVVWEIPKRKEYVSDY